MKERMKNKRCGSWVVFLFALAFGALFTVNAQAFTVNVVDDTGAGITGGFRWLLEEDNTDIAVPGNVTNESISTLIHKSHAPVVASGSAPGNSALINNDVNGTLLDSAKQYFISVLPDAGYSNSGTVVVGLGDVTVTVNPLPLPTAQISLFAFVDHNPINNVFDEHDQGLGGATVLLYDNAGQVSQDAFGNPLGTQYLPDGTITQIGSGSITTLTQTQFNAGGPANNPYNLKVGEALIKYLVPGKYGLKVVPPGFDDDGIAMTWSQTSTIEGTPTVDAWVKANEPKLFTEGFGTGFNHVFYGFVKVSPATSTFKDQTFTTLEWNQSPPAATGTISGTLRMNHFSKPPTLQGFHPGVTVPSGWIGINDPLVLPGAGLGEAGKYIAPTNEDGSFTITNVPPGTYQLVTWDTFLDTLFGIHTVTVPPGPGGTGDDVVLGDVLTFRWFGTLNNYVFFDADEDGFRDPGESGIPEQNVNIRFRDGTIYQAFPTDIDGFVPFDEVFPFFKWLVVEVDYARFKATGMTTAIDDGGAIPGPSWPANGNKNPQPQNPADPANEYGTVDYRTETGPVLTEAMHLFLGQTNLIEWGKSHYADGENGGISGIVFYAVTRAENDPRYAAAEGWEPGVPRVQVNLYEDMIDISGGLPGVIGSDGVIDDLDGDGGVTLADVDNYPFQWAPMYAFLEDGVTPNPDFTGVAGPEDVDLNYPGQTPGVFDTGDAIQIATTDSWDDNTPSGCIQNLPQVGGLPINECADSFGTWNQVRPGIFDGGYAFNTYYPEGIVSGSPETVLPSGNYIVEAVTPPGYELLKEEDKNVDFGDTYVPSLLLLPPVCVGDLRTVPDFLSFDGVTDAPFAGQTRPLCDRKMVNLSNGQNAAADFFVFTQVPKAARAVGFVNNDLGAEFNQASPIYGEKLAASWLPVSFRDWQGKELVRVYTDQFGGYNAMLPSTYTVNVPSPTGVSPSMITLVLNDPFMSDGVTPDPFHDPDYAVTPWTFNYMPGATSYLDTPIVPTTAFAANDTRIDTGPFNGTPVIYSVTTSGLPGPVTQSGPLVCTDTTLVDGTGTVIINAPPGGFVDIRNPDFPNNSIDPTVSREVGFGTTQGSGTVTLDGVSLDIDTWTNTQIVAFVPNGAATGEIKVTRDNGSSTEVGITLNIVDCSGGLIIHEVPGEFASIQAAVDAAAAGDIILVEPGLYSTNVVVNKPVRLQGSGTGTVIDANPIPVDRLDAWHARVDALGAQAFISYLLKNPFSAGEAPAFFVVGETEFPLGNNQNPLPGTQLLNPGFPFDTPGQAAIDGFKLIGSKAGGAIFAVSGARDLVISNNEIVNNQGNFAGGIAIGTPDSGYPVDETGVSINKGIVIRHNKIHRNGGVQGGGGIALNEGSEGYLVEENIITGNFGRFNGGGIQHSGLSLGDNIIRNNRIIFNEIFFGAILAVAGDGAGIFIGGDVAGGTGSGSVTIDSNLIQGNMSGAGNGGGIRAFAVNGDDVRSAPADDTNWYGLNIFNNIIVNNIAGNSGGGISLQDVARANIVNNTIARNDSTATSVLNFPVGQVNSTPTPAGIASNLHSTILQGLFDPGLSEPTYSDPLLVNNIIRQNRSYYFNRSLIDPVTGNNTGGLALNPAGQYWDIHVVGSLSATDPHLNPDYCMLSGLTNPATGFDYTLGGADTTNNASNPLFLAAYFNNIQSSTVVDEGGNAINLRFTPILIGSSNYHNGPGFGWDNGTNALLGTFPELSLDFDGETRPFAAGVSDIGADEIQAVPAPLSPIALGNKGTAAQLENSGPSTNLQIGSMADESSPGLGRTIARQTGNIIDKVRETVAGVVESIIPGNSDSTLPGRAGSGSAAPLAENASGFSSGKTVPAGTGQSPSVGMLQGGGETESLLDGAVAVLDETSNSLALLNPVQREASMSGYGTGREVSIAKTDQVETSSAVTRQQDESNSSMIRYALVGLLLAGLAVVFFVFILPKTNIKREQ